MDSVQKQLTNIPLPLFYPLAAACVGVAAIAGSLPGRFVPSGLHGPTAWGRPQSLNREGTRAR
jgi:hypothetical protein